MILSQPNNEDEQHPEKKKDTHWGNPFKKLLINPVVAVSKLPVKIVGTVASGVSHGVHHVANFVTGGGHSQNEKEAD